MEKKYHHVLFGAENPLLDISAHVSKEFVDKYDCVFGNAILASEKHMPVYEDIVKTHKDVKYIAGGSTQNTFRVFTWMLKEKNSAVFVGCVGNDKYGEFLKNESEKSGLETQYLIDKKESTGTCAVLIHGKERSLITNLAAANCYKSEHLVSKDISKLMEEAKFYYSTGYFLTVSPESMLIMAKHAASENKVFMTNLAATFVCEFFTKQLLDTIPYSDYLFGNKDEVLSLSKALKFDTEDIKEIAKRVSLMEKINKNRDRCVVFTQGSENIIVAINGKIQEFDVPKLEKNLIVDMNGAGDAFCGGFISQLVQGKELKICVKAGNYAASVIIQNDGCTFPEKPNFNE